MPSDNIGQSIDLLPISVWVGSPDGCILQCNQFFKEYCGLNSTELESSWRKTLFIGDHQKFDESWGKARESSIGCELYLKFLRKDGQFRWHFCRITPSFSSDGKVSHWLGLAIDVHEQRKNQLISEAFLKHIEAVFWSTDANGVFTYYDGRARPDEIQSPARVGKSIFETSAHFPEVIVAVKDALNGASRRLEAHFNNQWFETNIVPQLDSSGVVTGVIGFSINITERKEIEIENLRNKKDLSDFKFAIDQSSILVTTDSSGKITYVNDKFCEISQYSREELIGKDHRMINSGTHSPEFFKDLWKTISSGKVWEGEICNRAKNGNFYWVQTSIVPFLNDSGKPYQYVAIRNDITRLKTVMNEKISAEKDKARSQVNEQAALQASQMKSEFLANMSHEIRTPLNSVIGMTDLILDSKLSPEQEEFAHAIKSSAGLLGSLINDILDFTKIESGKMDVENISFDLREVVLSVEREQLYVARKKGISFLLENASRIPVGVVGDPVKIRQVITNLISNGIKFTDKGVVILRVLIDNETANEVSLRFEVEDTGVGISKENVTRLFKPFVQSDSSTTRRYGGTGLGLSICKKLVDLMGGSIGMESAVNVGSTFWFRLNLEKTMLTSLANANQMHFTQTKALNPNSRILLVEDIPANQRVIELLLLKQGLKIEIASNGQEAVQRLMQSDYDLIFMDCHMPVMDGYTATNEIRNTLKKQVPIVALTASVMIDDRERCLSVGMNDYLAKPITKEELTRCLHKWLHAPGGVQSKVARDKSNSIDWLVVARLLELDQDPKQGGKSEILTEMLGLFEKNVPQHFVLIFEAISRSHAQDLLREFHALKSATCYLGAIGIGRLCDEARDCIHEKNFDRLKAIYQELKTEYQRVLQILS